MNIISARNPERTANGISLLVTFETLGEIPFHASPSDVEEHGRLIYDSANAGDFGEVADYVAPVVIPSVTPSVTQRQAKLALLSAGFLDDVEAAIDAITDPATKRVAQIEWEYAQEIKRDWPLLVQLATSMGMTDADLDELFTQAALL